VFLILCSHTVIKPVGTVVDKRKGVVKMLAMAATAATAASGQRGTLGAGKQNNVNASGS